MIHLVITNSSDKEIVGEKIFYKNMIYFGNQKGDILINDPAVSDYHIAIEVTEIATTLHLRPEVEYFHLNGKRTKGTVNITEKDIIGIGSTEFRICKSEWEKETTKREILNKKLNEHIEQNSSVLSVLSLLDEDLKKLQ